MKLKQKSLKVKGGNTLRGPKIAKKMKNTIATKIQKDKSISNVDKPPAVSSVKRQNGSKMKGSVKDAIANAKLGLQTSMVEKAISALLQLHEAYRKKSKTLLLNDKDYVFLQLNLMKVPDVPEQRRKYVKLHHGIHGEDPEVCLFVKDWKARDHVKRTPDEMIEYSIDHYQELLKAHDIAGISAVMPTRQLRTEYDSYELKRKLVDRFDVFLCQSGLLDIGSFLKNIGIAFNKKNKLPLSLKFPKDPKTVDPAFKERVGTLLRTTWYSLKSHSDTISLRVGSVGHTIEQLRENVIYVLDQLTNDRTDDEPLPGGVPNIKSVALKTSRSKAVPVYLNLASPNSVPVPVVKSIRPNHEAVEGELSTMPGKKVTVLPSGDVFITEDSDEELIPGWDSDEEKEEEQKSEDEEQKEESSDEEEVPVKKEKKLTKKQKKPTAPEPEKDLSEDSDEEAEAAEQFYLTSRKKEVDINDESNEDDEEEKEEVMETKGKKKNSLKTKNKVTPKKAKTGKRKNQDTVAPKKTSERKKQKTGKK